MSSSDAKSSPGKSVRSRMGSLMRRSSTALNFVRPGNASRRSSSESLAIDTQQQSLKPPQALIDHTLPSPVPESPAVDPGQIFSPIPVIATAQPATPSAPIDIPVKTPPPHNNWGDGPVTLTPSAISTHAPTARSEAPEENSQPSEEALETVAAPQARTEDELSMDGVPGNPEAPRPTEDDPAPPYASKLDVTPPSTDEAVVGPKVADEVPPIQEPSTDKPQTEETPAEAPIDEEPQAAVEEPQAVVEEPQAVVENTEQPVDDEAAQPTTDLGEDAAVDPAPTADSPEALEVSSEQSAQPVSHDAGVEVHEAPPVSTPPTTHDVQLESASDETPELDENVQAVDYVGEPPAAIVAEDAEAGRSRGSTVSSQARPLTPPAVFTRASQSAKTSIAPSAAERATPLVVIGALPHGNMSTTSIRMYDNPFADPTDAADISTRVYSPDRADFQSPTEGRPADHQSIHSSSIVMPMPDVSQPSIQGGSQWNESASFNYPEDERNPLLRRPSQTSESAAFSMSAPGYGAISSPEQLGYARLGWLMHVLPDTSVYFTHPGLCIVTDIDIRRDSALHDVSTYLGGPRIRPPHGWELWLRNTGKSSARKPDHSFVHHDTRVVVPVTTDPEFVQRTPTELLALEAAYWSFVEKHPAHVVLPPSAFAETNDILTWAYTDRLLPSEARGKTPPFSQEECQELSTILKSVDANPSANQVALRTRVVGKVMLRICRWKQGKEPRATYSRSSGPPSLVRRAADSAIAAACLGIPYLFADRSRSRRDYESGMRSTAGSMLVVGAVACMIAAVILGASVTLISIPGLNDISRIAGFISIVLSASSLISALLALFRWKADIERNTYPGIGQEGFMLITRKSVLLSLPLVFLIWAIAAFVIGVSLHMLRGLVIPRHVGKYMQWAVVGTVGGLAGMLFACGLLLL